MGGRGRIIRKITRVCLTISETKGFHFSGWIHKRIWELTDFRCAHCRGAITPVCSFLLPASWDPGWEQHSPALQFYIRPPRGGS